MQYAKRPLILLSPSLFGAIRQLRSSFLPLVQDLHLAFAQASSGAESMTAGSENAVAPERGHILLIEDNDAVRDLTAELLRLGGYAVIESRGCTDALKTLSATTASIDLLVSDLILCDGTGVAMVEKVRQTHPAIKCLFISGYSRDSISPPVPECEFLQKPFSREELLARVHELSRL